MLESVCLQKSPLGSFVPWDVLSLGRFVSWDVLSFGTLCLGTFCPLGRFVPWDLMSWDVLSLGTFCLCTVPAPGVCLFFTKFKSYCMLLLLCRRKYIHVFILSCTVQYTVQYLFVLWYCLSIRNITTWAIPYHEWTVVINKWSMTPRPPPLPEQ